MKYTRRILVDFGDTHAGHRLGLLNPETLLPDENEIGETFYYNPQLTEAQKYLWSIYTKHIESIKSLAGDDEIIVIHHGDMTQGNKYVSEWVTTRMIDQVLMAEANLLPWLQLDNVKIMRFIKGTSSHVMGEASSEIAVTELLKRKYPEVSINIMYHGLLDIGGILVDCSHHGPGVGGRAWLQGNEARYYLRSIMMSEIMSGRTPPRIVLRGHFHAPVKEYLEVQGYESWLMIVPSYCMLGDYGRQATSSAFKTSNGMVAFEIIEYEDGVTTVYPHSYIDTIDIRTQEKL